MVVIRQSELSKGPAKQAQMPAQVEGGRQSAPGMLPYLPSSPSQPLATPFYDPAISQKSCRASGLVGPLSLCGGAEREAAQLPSIRPANAGRDGQQRDALSSSSGGGERQAGVGKAEGPNHDKETGAAGTEA